MYAPSWRDAIAATERATRYPREDCQYYGNHGANMSANCCQNKATHDYGRPINRVRFACDEHAAALGFASLCRRMNHNH